MKPLYPDFFRKPAAVVSVFVCLFCIESTYSQSSVEIDESIKVLHLGDWIDGVVIDIKKKKIRARYNWAGNSSEGEFDRHEVRRLYEADTMDFGRTWESSNGSFKVDAALKEIAGPEVVLIKSNLVEIRVPLSQLAARDKAYVRKLIKSNETAVAGGNVPAKIPVLPEIETYMRFFGSVSAFAPDPARPLKTLAAIPDYLTGFEKAGVGINRIRKDQELTAVIPVGGPEQLVLISARERNPFNSGEQFQSQLYWVSLKQEKVIGFVSITHEDYAIDYDPMQKKLLTFNRKEEFADQTDEPDHYTLWNLEPGGTVVEPIARWQGDGMSAYEHQFAKIINDRIIIAKTERQTYQAWDIVAKRSIYVVKQQSFFDTPIVLNPDRSVLIVPEDRQISVINATTGECEFCLEVHDRHISGANINSSGTRLAAVSERNIYVWDLESGNREPVVYPAHLMGSPFKSRLEWIDDDHILGESQAQRILYRLSWKLPVWSYKMDVHDYFLNRDPLKNMVVDGFIFYVAEPSHSDSSIAVGAVKLPGPGVDKALQQIDRTSLLMLKPGVRVGLDLENVTSARQTEAWLKEKIAANQWVYDHAAEIRLKAEMGIGQQQAVTYEEIGQNGNETTVVFKPHFSRLKIQKGNLIIWQSGTSTGSPSVIHGSNVQQQVTRYQEPQPMFFENVKIEKEILDPKYSRGFGVSKLGLMGIELVSTLPPGREDDPWEASKKAAEDERKAAKAKLTGKKNE